MESICYNCGQAIGPGPDVTTIMVKVLRPTTGPAVMERKPIHARCPRTVK